MTAARLLDHLKHVRQVGPNRWIASCPAHDDRSPSLSVRELEDGRLLIHDFAGCSAADVMAAVGLSLADLFPERLHQHITSSRDRKHWHAARDALKALHIEVLVVAVAAENVAAGIKLEDADRERLLQAAGKIRTAAEACV